MHDTVDFLRRHKLPILLIVISLLIIFALWVIPKWQLTSEAVFFSQALAFLGQHKLPILLIVISLLIIFALWVIPKRQLASCEASLDLKDLIELENETRRTWAQILGGLVILAGLYFTWQTVKVSQETLVVSQEGQITERFTRAIDQLGSAKLEIRLGGIYALERIARDSERDHWPIIEILTAYVRENAPWEDQPSTPLPTDIQAVLTVLGRRTWTYAKGENQRLDLNNVDIRGADLVTAHLEGAILVGAHLERADLWGANLQGARLSRANLQGASLERANLQDAYLSFANLQGAFLIEANLHGADLGFALLQGANMLDANLQGADLIFADLEGAPLQSADLRGTILMKANLQRTILTEAKYNDATRWPEGFTPPPEAVNVDAAMSSNWD